MTDIACLEWVRHRAVTLAPETAADVERHIAECAGCRQKVAGFEALERSFHAYGAPMSQPVALRAGRWLRAAAAVLVAAIVVVVAWNVVT